MVDNNDKNIKEALNHSIFDDPVDLFNFNQIQPSPSLSYAKMIQASRSVPGSRRNSNDDHTLDLLLGTKLSLNDRESGYDIHMCMLLHCAHMFYVVLVESCPLP